MKIGLGDGRSKSGSARQRGLYQVDGILVPTPLKMRGRHNNERAPAMKEGTRRKDWTKAVGTMAPSRGAPLSLPTQSFW